MTRITQLNSFAFTYNGMFNWPERFLDSHKNSGFTSEVLTDGRILVFNHGIQWAIWNPKTSSLNTNAHVSKVQW